MIASSEYPSKTPFLSFDNVTLSRFNGFMPHSQVGGTAFYQQGNQVFTCRRHLLCGALAMNIMS